MNAILFGISPDMVAESSFCFLAKIEEIYTFWLLVFCRNTQDQWGGSRRRHNGNDASRQRKKVKEHKTVKMFLWVTIIFLFPLLCAFNLMLCSAEKEWGDGIRGLALSAARYSLLRLEEGM